MDEAKPMAAADGKQELEDALLRIVHQQQHHTNPSANSNELRAKKHALRSAARIADLLVDTVDGGGVQCRSSSLTRSASSLRPALLATVARYRKQTDQWHAATNEIISALKEIGDFENWMKIMDFDCKSINAAIRNIHQS